MRLIKLTYLIDYRFNGSLQVSGYAIDSDVPVRLCARKINNRTYWQMDHYDTGLGISYPQKTRRECIARGLDFIRGKIASGAYATAIHNIKSRE